MSKRSERFLKIAARIAEGSGNRDYRHGAVLVKGGSVVNTACNNLRFVNWANRFRDHGCGHATHHAELGAVLGVDKAVTKNAVIYVARIGRQGHHRLSKPCPMCMTIMQHVGIKKVVYTVDDGEYETINLKHENEDYFYKEQEE